MVPAALVLVLLSGAGAAAPTRNILYMIADDMRPEWDAYCPTCGLHTRDQRSSIGNAGRRGGGARAAMR